jgi:SPP1 family predicted phage head-tail adaptor
MSAWPQLDPGKAIHRIAILKQTTVTDISGTATKWVKFVDAWAEIKPVRGTEVLKSGQDTAQLFLTVTIYWQAGIQSNMRVQSLNGTYIIQTIENPGMRNVILILNCLALGLNQ